MDKDIEELPPEINSIENPIFSCDPTLTLRKVQDNLDATEILGKLSPAPPPPNINHSQFLILLKIPENLDATKILGRLSPPPLPTHYNPLQASRQP